MARAGTIRPTSATTGMERPTPMGSAWPLHGVRERVGVSRSGSATPRAILIITIRGGVHGATTGLAAGVRFGVTVMADLPAQTYTAAGAIPPTPVPQRRGRIRIQGTMAEQTEPPSRTRNAVRWA